MDEKLGKEIRKFALQNALSHNGKTRDKVILGKILGTRPELRDKSKDIADDITSIVNDVNNLSLDAQKLEIEKEFPEILIPKEKPKTQQTFPALQDAVKENVITRFPPEPNGYPHIGHAKAAIINEEYVNMYGGKKILRMDDTNPENERLEYYAAIKVGLEWLGIEYDIIKNTSDDMELLYQKGKEIISLNKAYVCTCKRDDISKNRKEKKYCKCSKGDQKQNDQRWEKMFEKYKQGEAIVRFRGDMESENTVMRDPILFRIIQAKHPILGKKYRVWPSYDFAVAIEDSIDGVTHAFRSKEYELRAELYYAILDALHMRKPKMLEFSRLEFKGMPVSKRIIKPLIQDGKVSGYDDPRLPTLEAMKRRGITPQAIRKFIISLGLTKADTLAPFDVLESLNRKIIDPTSIRLFYLREPLKIFVNGISSTVNLPNHPSMDLGQREIHIDGNICIENQTIQVGTKLRLMGLCNIEITQTMPNVLAQYLDDEINVDYQKIQWIPEKDLHKIQIQKPLELFINDEFNKDSLEVSEIYTEKYYLELKENTEIQYIRLGYCRKDSRNISILTHK